MMKEEWLFPGAAVPVDVETTAALVAEIRRLIDVVGGMKLAQLVQPADLQKRLADLHLYEEIAEHYAKCAISPEALRDWVAERMDTPPLPVQERVTRISWDARGVRTVDGVPDDVSPQRPWLGLTAQEAADCWTTNATKTWHNFEAKLKEKNT